MFLRLGVTLYLTTSRLPLHCIPDMQKQFLVKLVAAALLIGINPSFATANSGTNSVTSTLDLKIQKTQWWGEYYLSQLNVTGVNQEQVIDTSNTNALSGSIEKEKVNNKLILQGKPGKIYAVWSGPQSGGPYPFLAAWEGPKKNLPLAKLSGWKVSNLFVQEPSNPKNTIQGTLKTKVSGFTYKEPVTGQTIFEGVVPDTGDTNVPKDQKKITGYTSFGLVFPDAIPDPKDPDANKIRGWGPFTSDFKKLFFSGKVRITGVYEVKAGS